MPALRCGGVLDAEADFAGWGLGLERGRGQEKNNGNMRKPLITLALKQPILYIFPPSGFLFTLFQLIVAVSIRGCSGVVRGSLAGRSGSLRVEWDLISSEIICFVGDTWDHSVIFRFVTAAGGCGQTYMTNSMHERSGAG